MSNRMRINFLYYLDQNAIVFADYCRWFWRWPTTEMRSSVAFIIVVVISTRFIVVPLVRILHLSKKRDL